MARPKTKEDWEKVAADAAEMGSEMEAHIDMVLRDAMSGPPEEVLESIEGYFEAVGWPRELERALPKSLRLLAELSSNEDPEIALKTRTALAQFGLTPEQAIHFSSLPSHLLRAALNAKKTPGDRS